MQYYWLILGILCVWRVTNLLYEEDGPWNIFQKMRDAVERGFWGEVMGCFNCLSLWVSPVFAYLIGEGFKEFFFLWLSLSGGAILVQRATEKQASAPPIYYYEGDENEEG